MNRTMTSCTRTAVTARDTTRTAAGRRDAHASPVPEKMSRDRPKERVATTSTSVIAARVEVLHLRTFFFRSFMAAVLHLAGERGTSGTTARSTIGTPVPATWLPGLGYVRDERGQPVAVEQVGRAHGLARAHVVEGGAHLGQVHALQIGPGEPVGGQLHTHRAALILVRGRGPGLPVDDVPAAGLRVVENGVHPPAD